MGGPVWGQFWANFGSIGRPLVHHWQTIMAKRALSAKIDVSPGLYRCRRTRSTREECSMGIGRRCTRVSTETTRSSGVMRPRSERRNMERVRLHLRRVRRWVRQRRKRPIPWRLRHLRRPRLRRPRRKRRKRGRKRGKGRRKRRTRGRKRRKGRRKRRNRGRKRGKGRRK